METLLEALLKKEKLTNPTTHSKKELKNNLVYIKKFAKLYYKDLQKLHCEKEVAKHMVLVNANFIKEALSQIDLSFYNQEDIQNFIVKKARVVLIKDYVLKIKNNGILQNKNFENIFQADSAKLEEYKQIKNINQDFLSALKTGLENVKIELDVNVQMKNNGSLLKQIDENKKNLEKYTEKTKVILKEMNQNLKERKITFEKLKTAKEQLKQTEATILDNLYSMTVKQQDLATNQGKQKKLNKELAKINENAKKLIVKKDTQAKLVEDLTTSLNEINSKYDVCKEEYDNLDKQKLVCYKTHENLVAQNNLVNHNIEVLTESYDMTKNLIKTLTKSKTNDLAFGL